jgi:hypothetical protein
LSGGQAERLSDVTMVQCPGASAIASDANSPSPAPGSRVIDRIGDPTELLRRRIGASARRFPSQTNGVWRLRSSSTCTAASSARRGTSVPRAGISSRECSWDVGRDLEYMNPSEWGRGSGRCSECAFDSSDCDYALVGECMRSVASFRCSPLADRPSAGGGTRTVVREPLSVAHGRCPQIRNRKTLDHQCRSGGRRAGAWDENDNAEVRSYDDLSPIVGLIALSEFAQVWRQAALEAPHGVATAHPEAGEICAFDVVQRNAHEVCHHLWDVQRGMEAPVPAG